MIFFISENKLKTNELNCIFIQLNSTMKLVVTAKNCMMDSISKIAELIEHK